MSYFKNDTPESQGVESGAILDFLKDVDRKGLEMHRFLVIRHGVCVARTCYEPFTEEDMHPLYSFSKSLTATAIGFAVQEGILSLDDRMVDFFPEKIPQKEEFLTEDGKIPACRYPDEESAETADDLLKNLREIKIRDLLCMGCGQETEIGDHSAGWIGSFFRQPVFHKPGTFFRYNTAGTNMLCAILKKKTGQNVTEFLKKRLFESVGIGPVVCAVLPDELGTEMGGGGMKMTFEGMARFTWFMAQDGYWDGKPLLPGWYSIAGRKKIETATKAAGCVKDWSYGYGYQCWMDNLPGSFRADGAYGQFGIVYPTLDMIVVMNMNVIQTQMMFDSLNEILLPAVHEQGTVLKESGRFEELSAFLKNASLPALRSEINPAMEEKLNGVEFSADPVLGKGSGFDFLVGGSGIFDPDREAHITAMSFEWAEGNLIWKVTEKSGDEIRTHVVKASLCHGFLRSEDPANGKCYAASAGWRSFRALEMKVMRMDALSGIQIIFRFEEDRLSIEADDAVLSEFGLGQFQRQISVMKRKRDTK